MRRDIIDYEVYPPGFGWGSPIKGVKFRTIARARRYAKTLGNNTEINRGVTRRYFERGITIFGSRAWLLFHGRWINDPKIRRHGNRILNKTHQRPTTRREWDAINAGLEPANTFAKRSRR